ncbi:MAG: TolC family protein, partial [Tepidisphaeraceae bacterium]
DPTWSVGPGLALPLPIFDWGQAARESARARVVESRHKLTELRRRIVEEVRIAIDETIWALEALAAIEGELIPLQEARRDQAHSAYRVGHADVISFRLAEQDLQAARAKRIELRRRALEASLALDRAVGGSGIARNVLPSTRPATKPSHGLDTE